jgi:uncharacterized protein (TIGR01777 family)
MKVAITGATGFIGRSLAAYLHTLGHECIALTRPFNDVPPVDAVIHLAGENPAGLWTPWKRRAIYTSRVDGTRRLVAALHRAPPRVLLCASAVGIYGHRPGETLDESSPPDPQQRFRARVCQAWEHAASEATEFDTRVVHLRLGNVMDPAGGFLAKLLPVYRAGGCFVLGDPAASIAWVSLFDAVRLIAFAMESDALCGPLNVVAPHALTQHALTHTLARRLGVRVRGRIPAPLLRGVLGEFASALIDDQNVLPEKALGAGFLFAHPAWRSALDAIFGDDELQIQSTNSAIS